jgi:hypothetical protein
MTSFVIDANGSAIMFPGRVLVLTLPEHLVQAHEQGNQLGMIPLPVFAGVEQLLPNDHVEIRISHPETGEPFYIAVDGFCLEWVPR